MCHIYITHFEQPEKMKHTAEHTVGLTLLSQALADLYNIQIAPADMEAHLDKNEYGKPYLKDYPQIHFNISHASDIAICAISNQKIGADVEVLKDFHTSIFRKVFTEEEKAFYDKMAINEEASREWFFRFWTLKEARIKHAGLGLSMSLTSFSFSFDTETEPYVIQCSDADVHCWQKIIENQYVLSVCSSIPITNCNIQYI